MARLSARRMLIAALGGFAVLVAAYAGLAVYKASDYTTTPPSPLGTTTPDEFGIAYEDVTFAPVSDEDIVLSGWWIKREDARRTAVLVHGRYQNRTAMLGLARELWEREYNVLLFDLRGHGRSTSTQASYGLREQWDVLGAVEFLEGRGISRQSVGVVGWSLGGASALMALAQPPGLQAVVSDSAYADGSPLLADNLLKPGLKLALDLVQGVDIDAVRPADAVGRAQTGSVFLIHGAVDRAVPVEHLQRIQQAGGDRVVQTWIVDDAGHIGSYALHPDEYVDRVNAFFRMTLVPDTESR